MPAGEGAGPLGAAGGARRDGVAADRRVERCGGVPGDRRCRRGRSARPSSRRRWTGWSGPSRRQAAMRSDSLLRAPACAARAWRCRRPARGSGSPVRRSPPWRRADGRAAAPVHRQSVPRGRRRRRAGRAPRSERAASCPAASVWSGREQVGSRSVGAPAVEVVGRRRVPEAVAAQPDDLAGFVGQLDELPGHLRVRHGWRRCRVAASPALVRAVDDGEWSRGSTGWVADWDRCSWP